VSRHPGGCGVRRRSASPEPPRPPPSLRRPPRPGPAPSPAATTPCSWPHRRGWPRSRIPSPADHAVALSEHHHAARPDRALLTPSRYLQGCREAVANQRVDVCDVRRGQPTSKADDRLELVERRPAALASFEMLIDTPALALVHLAVEVCGHQANELDAPEVLLPRPATVQGGSPSPRGDVPGVCEPDRGRDGVGLAPHRGQAPALGGPHRAPVLRRREARSPAA
jgi:hypothetical protein